MSNYDPTDINDLERVQEQSERSAKQSKDTEESDIKWLMSSKRGRRIIWRLLERAGIFRLSFNTNAMQMAFNEGSRNEGLRMVGLIHTLCPELYATLVKENANGNDDDRSRNDQ